MHYYFFSLYEKNGKILRRLLYWRDLFFNADFVLLQMYVSWYGYNLLCVSWSEYVLHCRDEEKLKKFREEAKTLQRQKDYEKYTNGGKLGNVLVV